MMKLVTLGLLWWAGLGLSASQGAAVETNGPLDRLVSYFSQDLKNLDEEMARLKLKLNLTPIPLQQTNHFGFSSTLAPSVNARWVELDLGRVVNIDKIVLVPMDNGFYGWPGPGYGFPVRYRVEVSMNPDFSNALPIATVEGNDVPNPGSNPRVYSTGDTVIGRYVRVSATVLWSRKDNQGVAVGTKVFALGELMVLYGNLNFNIAYD